MTTVLGINAYHGDASAALVVDGMLVAAVEEERFNRIKHWAGFPAQSIRWCLEHAGIQPHQINHVAISFQPRANLLKKVGFVLRNQTSPKAILQRIKRQSRTLGLEDELARAFDTPRSELKATLHRIEHHHAHIGAGFLISPFEDAAVLSIDGMGDFVSTVTAYARKSRWMEYERVFFPHSVGYLYTAITYYLGFPHFGDEHKVMALAASGEPEYADFFRKLIYPKNDTFEINLDYFTHHKRDISLLHENGAPVVEPFFSSRLLQELGPIREKGSAIERKHENIAASLQLVTEEILFHLLNRLHRRTACKRLCLTGSVATNSVANGKITRNTPFKEVHIPAGAADNGTSIGAAFCVWNQVLENKRTFVQTHAYWGCEYSEDESLQAIKAAGVPHQHRPHESDLLDHIVTRIINGEVVGWFQGRMEFGKYSLGNRTLLADPRKGALVEKISQHSGIPGQSCLIAILVLEEEADDWFEGDTHSPYQTKALPFKLDRLNSLPGLTPAGRSVQLQTVSKETNPRFYALIHRFKDRTGIPLLLTPPLHGHHPPLRTPAEAIAYFQHNSLDALVIGNNIVHRTIPPPDQS